MATNFYGTVNIGTKVDVEPGGTYIRTKVESGGTYNEYAADKAVNNNEKEEKNPLSNELLRAYIDMLLPEITLKNQWFAIFKPLTWVGLLKSNEYEGAARFIRSFYPEGLKVEVSPDALRKLDVDSLRKELEKWDENDSPIHGSRFYKLQSMTLTFYDMIAKHF